MSVTVQISGGKHVRVSANTVKIGRASACALSFPNEGHLDPEHAVLRRVANRWLIESRSGPVIQVGQSQLGRMHWLKPGDVVKLTPDGPEFTFEPVEDADPLAAARQSNVVEPSANSPAESVAAPASQDGAHAPARSTELRPEEPAVASATSPSNEFNTLTVATDEASDATSAHSTRGTEGAAFGPTKHLATWALGGAGLLVLGLFICLALLSLAGLFDTKMSLNETTPGIENGTEIAGNPQRSVESGMVHTKNGGGAGREVTTTVDVTKSKSGAALTEPAPPDVFPRRLDGRAMQQAERGVVWIGYEVSGSVFKDARRSFTYATGWAIEPDVIVTSGSNVFELRIAQEEGALPVVHDNDRYYHVEELQVHPEYNRNDPINNISCNVGVIILKESLDVSCQPADKDRLRALTAQTPLLVLAYVNDAGDQQPYDKLKVNLIRRKLTLASSSETPRTRATYYIIDIDGEFPRSAEGAPVMAYDGEVLGTLAKFGDLLTMVPISAVRTLLD